MWVGVDDLCVQSYDSKPGHWEYDRAKAATPMALQEGIRRSLTSGTIRRLPVTSIVCACSHSW